MDDLALTILSRPHPTYPQFFKSQNLPDWEINGSLSSGMCCLTRSVCFSSFFFLLWLQAPETSMLACRALRNSANILCSLPIHSTAGGNGTTQSQSERLTIISLGDVGLQGILISKDTFTSRETKILSIPLNGHQKRQAAGLSHRSSHHINCSKDHHGAMLIPSN